MAFFSSNNAISISVVHAPWLHVEVLAAVHPAFWAQMQYIYLSDALKQTSPVDASAHQAPTPSTQPPKTNNALEHHVAHRGERNRDANHCQDAVPDRELVHGVEPQHLLARGDAALYVVGVWVLIDGRVVGCLGGGNGGGLGGWVGGWLFPRGSGDRGGQGKHSFMSRAPISHPYHARIQKMKQRGMQLKSSLSLHRLFCSFSGASPVPLLLSVFVHDRSSPAVPFSYPLSSSYMQNTSI